MPGASGQPDGGWVVIFSVRYLGRGVFGRPVWNVEDEHGCRFGGHRDEQNANDQAQYLNIHPPSPVITSKLCQERTS